MLIQISNFEVQEALEEYLKNKYDFNLSLDMCDCFEIEYINTENIYKKHKNGKVVKDQKGFPIIDDTKTETRYISFDEWHNITVGLHHEY